MVKIGFGGLLLVALIILLALTGGYTYFAYRWQKYVVCLCSSAVVTGLGLIVVAVLLFCTRSRECSTIPPYIINILIILNILPQIPDAIIVWLRPPQWQVFAVFVVIHLILTPIYLALDPH